MALQFILFNLNAFNNFVNYSKHLGKFLKPHIHWNYKVNLKDGCFWH